MPAHVKIEKGTDTLADCQAACTIRSKCEAYDLLFRIRIPHFRSGCCFSDIYNLVVITLAPASPLTPASLKLLKRFKYFNAGSLAYGEKKKCVLWGDQKAETESYFFGFQNLQFFLQKILRPLQYEKTVEKTLNNFKSKPVEKVWSEWLLATLCPNLRAVYRKQTIHIKSTFVRSAEISFSNDFSYEVNGNSHNNSDSWKM